MDFFYFLSFGWKVQDSVYENVRKVFCWESFRNVLILELENSVSGNIRDFFRVDFFCFLFFCLGLGSVLGSCIVHYLLCLLVYSWGNDKSRGFCYPVLLSSCDIGHRWFKEFHGRRLLQRRLATYSAGSFSYAFYRWSLFLEWWYVFTTGSIFRILMFEFSVISKAFCQPYL